MGRDCRVTGRPVNRNRLQFGGGAAARPAATLADAMPTFEATDFYDLEALLTAEERQLRDRVRRWVDERFLPVVTEHYRAGTFPMELVPELAAARCLRAGDQGPWLPRAWGNVAAGLIMQELERGDSGLRTFASVQGSLAMMAIDLFGSEEQKSRWLPEMARGTKLGCFGLTEPDFGSNPGGMVTRARKTSRWLPAERREEMDRQRDDRRCRDCLGQSRWRTGGRSGERRRDPRFPRGEGDTGFHREIDRGQALAPRGADGGDRVRRLRAAGRARCCRKAAA